QRSMFVVGVAGCGKSSIAHSLAVQMQDEGLLGAFFAFDRAEPDRPPRRVLTTLAHGLALRNEDYRDTVVRRLKKISGLAGTTDISEQWEDLMVRPLTALSPSRPVLLVVDAFDECPGSPEDR
ncbi:hypothetical protein AURDEDRAFT_28000, partial [Auricularia subglabra TFB-10046 SS5]